MATPVDKTRTVKLAGCELELLVAETISERAFGLSGRDSIDCAGMLFVRPAEMDGAFTMAGVRWPLLMAFFSGTGRLIAQVVRQPEDGPWRPPKPFRYAVELTDLTPLPEDATLEL